MRAQGEEGAPRSVERDAEGGGHGRGELFPAGHDEDPGTMTG